MSATDELRKMLDERGVEWMAIAWNTKRETFYRTENGVGFCADEYVDGLIIHTDDPISPEQAIAATLGAGTCHDANARFNAWVCSECDSTVLLMFDDYGEPTLNIDGVASTPNYCPNCGAKVVD